MTENEKPWLGHESDLVFANEAVDRELEDHARREAAMQSRGTILIGAASLVGVIQLTNDLQAASLFYETLNVLHLVLSLLAAVAGVIVLFPRDGDGFNARTLRDELLNGTSKEKVLYETVRAKLENLEADEKSLGGRANVARVGFIFLSLGVLAAVIGAIAPISGPMVTQPTPTVVVSHAP